MSRIYVPFMIKKGNKKEIWQVDVTDLSTIELMKLRERLKRTSYYITLTILDKIIYNSMDEFRCSDNITSKGMLKEQKRNKKLEKSKRRR